jgi:hypothetical protein
MTNPTATPSSSWTTKLSDGLAAPVVMTRNGHGGLAWSSPMGDRKMRQPQDGALDKRRRIAVMNSQLHSNLLNEPEDARLTGGTRSLTRRLLGLNVGKKNRKSPEASNKVVAARPQVA